MSDTPNPAPAPEPTPKPKLNLAPKAPSPAAPPPAAQAPVAPPADAAIPPVSSPVLQAGVGNSNSTPPSLSSPRTGAPKPALKLQGTPHPASAPAAPAFKSPMPAAVDDQPSMAVVVLSFLAAAAAITFAVLLYLKNQ